MYHDRSRESYNELSVLFQVDLHFEIKLLLYSVKFECEC